MSAETRLLEKLQDHLARLATELEEIKNQRDHFHHELIQNRDENAQLRITNAQLSTEKAQWLAERARLQTKVESLELREFDSQQKRSSAAGSVSTVSPSTDSTPVPDQKPRFSGTHDDEVIDLTLDEESQPVGSVSKIPAASGTQFNVRSDSDARVRSQRRIKSEIKAEESIDFSQLIPESADSYIGATGGIFVIDDNDNCITTSAEKMIPKKRERSLSPSDIVLPPTPSSNRSRSATTQENEWYTPVGDDSASNSLPKVEDGAWSDNSNNRGSKLTELSDSDVSESENPGGGNRRRTRNVADGTTTRIKVEATIVVNINTVNRHLDGLKPLSFTTHSNLISRLAFSRSIGGNPMDFLVPITPTAHSGLPVNKNGDRSKWAAVFPQTDRNPYMPLVPGAPGILFSMHMELRDRPEWTLFRPREKKVPVTGEDGRTVEKKAIVWEYLGDYEFRHVGSLSAAEFREQRAKVKWWWSEKILKTKKWPHYVAIRARVHLRKHNRQITDTAVQEIQNGLVSTAGLTVEDIISAFERGDEAIEIWALECRRYDHDFNNSLAGLTGHAFSRRRRKKPRTEKKTKGSRQLSTVVHPIPRHSEDVNVPSPPRRRSGRVAKPSAKALGGRSEQLAPSPESEEESDSSVNAYEQWKPALEESPEL